MVWNVYKGSKNAFSEAVEQKKEDESFVFPLNY